MKTFVIVEPNREVGQFMAETLTRFLTGRAKVVNFPSFDEALEKLPLSDEVAMVFVAFDAPTERGAYVAREIKRKLPNAKVILTSTFDAHEKTQQFGLDDFVSKIDFATIGKIGQLFQKHKVEL